MYSLCLHIHRSARQGTQQRKRTTELHIGWLLLLANSTLREPISLLTRSSQLKLIQVDHLRTKEGRGENENRKKNTTHTYLGPAWHVTKANRLIKRQLCLRPLIEPATNTISLHDTSDTLPSKGSKVNDSNVCEWWFIWRHSIQG